MATPTIEIREYYLNGLKCREEMTPPGYVVIDYYTPCSSVTPWDYHGMKHQREYSRVLTDAGIEHILLTTAKTIMSPMGTGPGGSIRFGDNMTPWEYRIAVSKYDDVKALDAIAEHKRQIDNWLCNGGKMPAACGL